eukprot:jgi/Chrzof1/10321/Cz04g37120.t1
MDANRPLLMGSSPGDSGANNLGELGEAGGTLSVQQLRDCTPEQAFTLLRQRGTKTLGTLTVPDAALKNALGTDGDDLLTAGSDSVDDFDWQRVWQEKLSAEQQKTGTYKGWTNDVPVISKTVMVEGAAQPGRKGLLQLVIKRYQVSGNSAIFTIPAVEAVITYKWNAFGRRLLLLELAVYLAWLMSFTGFTWLIQDEDLSLSLSELVQQPSGLAAVVLEVLALIFMVPFLFIELSTIRAYGVYQWANIWNLMDSCCYGLQVLITVVHLQRDAVSSNWFSVVLALQCLLLWAKVQYFSRVLQATSTSFVDTLKAVISDVRYFLMFLILTLYSFAAAFHILFRKDQKDIEQFSSFFHTIGSVFVFAAGGPDMEPLWASSVPYAATILCVFYTFVMSIMLLNLLIAVMSDSYSRIMDREESRYRSNQAVMIDELEATIPSFCYSSSWMPRYVHFLQRENDTDDDGQQSEGQKGSAGSDDVTARLERLEKLVMGLEDRLMTKLTELKDHGGNNGTEMME